MQHYNTYRSWRRKTDLRFAINIDWLVLRTKIHAIIRALTDKKRYTGEWRKTHFQEKRQSERVSNECSLRSYVNSKEIDQSLRTYLCCSKYKFTGSVNVKCLKKLTILNAIVITTFYK